MLSPGFGLASFHSPGQDQKEARWELFRPAVPTGAEGLARLIDAPGAFHRRGRVPGTLTVN